MSVAELLPYVAIGVFLTVWILGLLRLWCEERRPRGGNFEGVIREPSKPWVNSGCGRTYEVYSLTDGSELTVYKDGEISRRVP